jgi:hypothetical protein
MTNRKDPKNMAERLMKALENIDTCEGSAFERAKWAALDIVPLLPEDFPEKEQQDDFDFIRNSSTLLQVSNPPDSPRRRV